ncbi:hypothetical protein HK096_001753 [Nowakowskiella sp. JEL0078]|nr:hypothetical protein HK096_001753 [Nowakowskiella sp. JEL0078]
MSGLVVMTGFKNDFGDLSHAANPAINGLLFSLLQMGAVAMFAFVGPVNDKFGRRVGMQVGSVLVILGSILQLASTSIVLFCIGRFLIGGGTCFVVTSAPTYVVEISHPVFRGRATGLYNGGYNFGAILSAVLLYVFSQSGVTSSAAWQIPSGLQMVLSVFVLIGCFFIPETPRWLVATGQTERAREFLILYHADGDAASEYVSEQIRAIEWMIETERAMHAGTYLALFNNRPNRVRMFVVVSVGLFSQMAGNWVAGYFQTQVLPYFGVVAESDKLLVNVATAAIAWVASVVGSIFVDKVGRRSYLVYGTFLYTLFFVMLTVVLAIYNQNEVTDSPKGPKEMGILAFVLLQLFGIVYAACWTSINALYPVEVLSYSTRAKGMAICQAVVNCANVFQAFVLSYGLNAWKWKFFSFYAVFNAAALVVVYLYFPETSGRTLEELDEVFNSPDPVVKSLEVPMPKNDAQPVKFKLKRVVTRNANQAQLELQQQERMELERERQTVVSAGDKRESRRAQKRAAAAPLIDPDHSHTPFVSVVTSLSQAASAAQTAPVHALARVEATWYACPPVELQVVCECLCVLKNGDSSLVSDEPVRAWPVIKKQISRAEFRNWFTNLRVNVDAIDMGSIKRAERIIMLDPAITYERLREVSTAGYKLLIIVAACLQYRGIAEELRAKGVELADLEKRVERSRNFLRCLSKDVLSVVNLAAVN